MIFLLITKLKERLLLKRRNQRIKEMILRNNKALKKPTIVLRNL